MSTIPPDVLKALQDASLLAFWEALIDHWRQFQRYQREALELWRLGDEVEAERAERFAEKRQKLALEMIGRFLQAMEQVRLSPEARQEALFLLNGELDKLDPEAGRRLACKTLAELEAACPANESVGTSPAPQPPAPADSPCPTTAASGPPEGSFLSFIALCDVLGIHPSRREAFRKALDRLRAEHRLSKPDYRYVKGAAVRESRYLYRSTSPTIQALARRYQAPDFGK